MAVIAWALASEGFMPFLHSFSFALLNAHTIKSDKAFWVDRFNVKITGRRDGVWGDLVIACIVEGLACTRNTAEFRDFKWPLM